MTDKQIIIYKKECYNEPHCSLNQVLEQLKAKEQECEELHKIINEAKNSKLDLKSFLVGEAIQNEYEQQLDQLKAENDKLKKANIHIDNNRMVKADKLKRIEDLIIACSSGYTDEFIQNLLVILHEPEPSFKSKLYKTLTEIKEIVEQGVKIHDDIIVSKQILQKISECEGNDENL